MSNDNPITNRPSCIVIGAGLAGLAAAYRLSKKGWQVVVLEAQGRLGGRVLTHRFKNDAPDLVCELGAEWIGEDHTRMLALCHEFGLETKHHQFSLSFWDNVEGRSRVYAPGAWCFTQPLKRKFDKFARDFAKLTPTQQRRLDDYDWWGRLEEMGFSPAELRKRDLMDSSDSGESIRLTSAYSAADEYCLPNKSKTNEMDYKIAGGNHLLIKKLAEAIEVENAVHSGAAVRAVVQTASRVEVLVEGRRAPLIAQFCICAVPTHSLLQIDWTPQIPQPQWNMARQLQYSRIMKSAVLYNNRFWKTPRTGGFSVFTNRASDFCFESTYGQEGEKAILCSYAIGDKADDLASEHNKNNVMRWITEDVAAATQPSPKIRVAPLDLEWKAWQREKWIGGAYAFYRPGQWFTVMFALQRPHRRVHFAGEHLSDEWQGFMEGAVESGYRAANAIMKKARTSRTSRARRPQRHK